MSSREPFEVLKNKIREAVTKILPHSEVDIEELKDEVWQDLSALYYKYENEEQKKAFREVVHEISEKLKDGKWYTVYKKLYREEQKEKTI